MFIFMFNVYFIFPGPFLLTLLLLDKLKKAPQGRIVNLVSPFYKKSEIKFDDLNSANEYHPKEAYGQSKLALMLFSQELAKRLKGRTIFMFSQVDGSKMALPGGHNLTLNYMGIVLMKSKLLGPI